MKSNRTCGDRRWSLRKLFRSLAAAAPKAVVLLLVLRLTPGATVPVLAADGDLDPAFGVGGKVTTDFSHQGDFINKIVIQSDGKIVAGGHASSPTTSFDFGLARYNPDGSLDTTFGAGGKVATDFFGGFDDLTGLAVLSDGKILAGGFTNTSLTSTKFALARYNSSGTLDTTFGTGGKVTTDGFFTEEFGAGEIDSGNDLAVLPDGRILMAGTVFLNNTPQASFSDFGVARYNSDGSLDTSFGTGGKTRIDFFGFTDDAKAIALSSNGEFFVAGSARFGTAQGSADFALAKFLSDGSLDTSFGASGRVETDLLFTEDDFCNAIVLQPDGKIVLAGQAAASAPTADFGIVRYLPDGSLDPSFGTFPGVTLGVAIAGFGDGSDKATSVAIQSDGKLVLGGAALLGSNRDFALARLQTDGQLDTTFGTDGKLTTDFAGSSDQCFDVALQTDGSIIAAGSAAIAGNSSDFALVRYANQGPCSFILSATSQTFSSDGGNGSVDVTIGACNDWTAVSNSSFIKITNGTNHSGNGSVNFTVDPNNQPASRTGTMTIATKIYTVTQGPKCIFTVSPGVQSIGAGGGNVSVSVNSPSGCAWQASSLTQYATITSINSDLGFGQQSHGSGNGTVFIKVLANTTSSAKGLTLVIAGKFVTINQSAATCTFVISPATKVANFGANGGNGSFTVSAISGCHWSVQAPGNFITILSSSSVNGSGTVSFRVNQNNSSSAREGSIVMLGDGNDPSSAQVFTVKQAGMACTLSVSPRIVGLHPPGGSGHFSIFGPAGCSFIAVRQVDWVSIKAAGDGIDYFVEANTSPDARGGTIKINDDVFFSIIQEGNIDCQNAAPFFISSSSSSTAVTQTFNYQAIARDPAGRRLTYSLGQGPAGMTINPFTGLVSWTVSSSLAGQTVLVSVVANNGQCNGIATQTFGLTLTAAPPPGGFKLQVGQMEISADSVSRISGSQIEPITQSSPRITLDGTYELGGEHVFINNILHLKGGIKVDVNQSALTMTITINSGEMFVDFDNIDRLGSQIPFIGSDLGRLGYLPLWRGQTLQFQLDGNGVITNLLQAGVQTPLRAAGVDVTIQSARLIIDGLSRPDGDLGITIFGQLNFPSVPGIPKLSAQFDNLIISRRLGVQFSGSLRVADFQVGGIGVKNVFLNFQAGSDPSHSTFEGGADISPPGMISIGGKVRIVGGKLDSVLAKVGLTGTGVPLGPLNLTGGQVSIMGLQNGPFTLAILGDFTIVNPLLANVISLSNAGFTYTSPGSISGQGDLKVLFSRAASTILKIDLPSSTFSAGINVTLLESFPVFIINGNIAAGVRNNHFFIEGDASGTIQFPDGRGFPFDLLKARPLPGIQLPITLAQASVAFHNGTFSSSVDFPVIHKVSLTIKNAHGAIETSIGTNFPGLPKKITVGTERRNNKDLLAALGRDASNFGGNPLEGNGLVIDAGPKAAQEVASVQVASDSPQAIFRLFSDSGPVRYDLIKPDGSRITPDSAGGTEIFFGQNTDDKVSFYVIANPLAGTWTIEAEDASQGPFVLDAWGSNVPPVINSVSGAQAGSSVTINYNASDADDDTTISLFYDTAPNGFQGQLIASGLPENETGSFTWDTVADGVRSGEYYVYALIDDGVNPPVRLYAPDKIVVTDPLGPATPQNVRVTQGDENSLIVTWTPNSETNLRGYQVQFTKDNGDGTQTTTVQDAGLTTTFRLKKLADKTTYFVSVAAYNQRDVPDPVDPEKTGIESRTSLFSEPVPGTTGTAIPPVIHLNTPNGGEQLTGNAPLQINWQAGNADDLADQQVELSADSGNTYTVLASHLDPAARNFIWDIPATLTGTKLRIRISVIDADGNEASDESDADFTVLQAPGCTFTADAGSKSFTSAGGTGTISVGGHPGCGWAAVSNDSWITIDSGSSGDGNGTVSYTIAANTGSARTGTITVAEKTFTISEDPNCAFSLSATQQDIAAASGTGSVNVISLAGCNWTSASNASFITITSGGSGSGNGTLSFSVAANTGPARSGTLTIAGLTFTVNQSVGCAFTISPSEKSLPSGGGTGTIDVTSDAGCAWTAASNDSWITITSGSQGSGNGTVAYSVAANTGLARTGTITVAGKTFTVQEEVNCTFTLSATQQDFAASGGTGTVNVTSLSGCNWTATSGAAFVTITLGSTGSGDGVVGFTVAANAGPARTATLTIAGKSFTVNQSSGCTFTIAPAQQDFPSIGGTGSIDVTSVTGCAWSAASNDSWITITTGAQGSGNGTVQYSIAANPGLARTGMLTVAGKTFTVNQAVNCTFTLSALQQDFLVAGGTGLVNVISPSGCSWSAVSNSPFVVITAGSAGSGNGTVNFLVAKNLITSARVGTLTIAGQTFTVNQAAAIAPSIASIVPASGCAGQSVTINGGGFAEATLVTFNGLSAAFTVTSASQILATVPAAATTGLVTVTTPVGTATSSVSFTVNVGPSIGSFSPGAGKIGKKVTITGSNLSGATNVSFGGVSATSISKNTATSLKAAVPPGAISGKISVTIGNGCTVLSDADFIAPPMITGVDPGSGAASSAFTITGLNFTGASTVKIGKTTVTSFNVVNNTTIVVTVPSGAKTGAVSVTTSAGTAKGPAFTVN